MGSNYSFTGLRILAGIVLSCFYLDSNRPLLLDNEPLSVAGVTIGIFAFGAVAFGLFWTTHPFCQDTRDKTAARSQVREPRTSFRRHLLLTLLLTSLSVCSGEVGGEGYVVSMGDVRAVEQSHANDTWLTAKQHGSEPRQIPESTQTSKQRKVCKRSFIRARHRASLHGHTWYRGKIYTAEQLGVSMKVPVATIPSKNVPPPKTVQRRRMTCFSWNCNGLPPDHWDFLTQWIQNQTIDIVLLQETHWRFTRDWTMDHYLVVHSGTSTEKAGLLCLISKKICSPSNLSWFEHIPGRILQLRLHGPNRSIDILNIYQYTCITTHMDQRRQLWHELFSLLSKLPKRNTLIMAGDFNCSADHRSNAIGYPTYRTNEGRSHGPRHVDASHWHQLLSQHDLVALNTWNMSDGATYEFCNQHSRIDYICTRRTHADKMAKDVQLLRDFTLVPITEAFHVPLLTTIRKEWYPDRPPSSHGWTRSQRLQLHQHCVQQDHVFTHFCTQLHEAIAHLGTKSSSDLETLHNTLNQFSGDIFEPVRSESSPVTAMGPVRRFQVHTKGLRQVQTSDLTGLFTAWFHVVHRCKARKDMIMASKLSRKRRLAQVYQAAAQAAQAKDHFQLFQSIRTLSPKQPLKRIMLRSAQGDLLGPEAAAEWLHQWFQDIYSDTPDATILSSFEWPFTLQEYAQGLQSLPTQKALAPGFTPAPFRKFGAELIAEFLDPMFRTCSQQHSFPSVWGMGSLALLIKPGKAGRHPSELRPIALLEPSGKAAMGLLNNAIHQQIGDALNRIPQFAYARGRGTDDAIHRLAHHCRQVRELMGVFSYPVHRLKQGLDPPTLVGGMTLCLDLTRAFDTVPRAHLFRGMAQLGVSGDLINFLKCVYSITTYEFEHRGVSKTVQTYRGIRQGCKAAPCLWTVFISALMQEFANETSMSFLLLCVTIFADDICSHQLFDSEDSFLTLLHAFGTLLDLIERAHLELNLSKTTITLRMKGKLAGKMQRKFIVRTQTGTYIKIPRSNGTHTRIKLVKSFRYLGVMMSYYNFERETMALRLKHSEQTSHQLHRWLYTQKMNAHQRTQIWYQCTYTCLRYGIIATGFSEVTLLSFYRFCIRQLRRIFKEPVHLFKENNFAFLSKHGIADPLMRLRDMCQQTASRALKRQQSLLADDVLQLTPLPAYDHLIQVIDKVHQQERADQCFDEVPPHMPQYECPDCHLVYQTTAALRRHCTIEHGHRSGLLRHMFNQPTAVVPTCHRCHTKFSTWHKFEYHMKFVCTGALQEIDQVEHRMRVQELLQHARAHQIAALRHNAEALVYFLHHCAICGKFHTTHTGLLRHWNDEHHQTYRDHQPALKYYCQHADTTNPCQLCTVSFAQYHRCIIWRQLAMLLTERQLTAEYCDVEALATLVCETCGKVYTTKHGLAQHIQKFHAAQQVLHASDDNRWTHFMAKCLFDQAVQTNRCEDLISDPDILHFISMECFDCSMPFKRRQDLSRHLKQGHPPEWAEMEQRASELMTQLQCVNRCLCDPPQHRVKHLCMVFLQFSLARLQWERAQSRDDNDLPPDLALKPQEKMEQLLWFGFGHLLYRQPALKLALTLTCQFCNFVCRCGDDLLLHLHHQHEALVAESSTYWQLLKWTLFQDFGCACNPTRGFGVANHVCPAILQAAMLVVQAHWTILIPWQFRTDDLLSHLGDHLALHDFRRISLWLITRQFDKLWKDPALLGLLKQRCAICGEAVSLQYITVHLRLEHQLGPNDLHLIVMQLCRIFSTEHSEEPYCDHCGELLPTLDVLEFDPVPEMHLPGCPLILHLAAFLMHPVLHKPPFDPVSWPTPQALENAFRRQEHQRLMFNARHLDTAGQEFDLLLSCGQQLLNDACITDCITHQCLLCHKLCLLPGKLVEHLKQHDYKQYNTMWCLRRLQQRHHPCNFCGSDPHPAAFVCPALLNLAVLLTNGRRPGQSEFDLEQLVDTRPTTKSGNQRRGGGEAEQTSTQKGAQQFYSYFNRSRPEDHGSGDGKDSAATGGHYQRSAPGVRVCPLSPTGRGQSASDADPMPSCVAEQRQEPITEAHHGPDHGRDVEGAAGQISPSTGHSRCVSGLCEVQPHQCQSGDAVSEMGCGDTTIGPEQGESPADWRGTKHHSEHPQDSPVGARDHSSISLADEAPAGGCQPEVHPISMDCGTQNSRGTLEPLANRVISQHLATCEIDPEATNATTICADQAAGKDDVDDKVKHLVRILENDTATMCFANATLTALSWITLLCQCLLPSKWMYGFELMRGLCQWNPLPLNLRVFQPFLWLLFGDFTVDDLSRQQDILEFTSFLIDRMRPTFLSCSWCTRFQHTTTSITSDFGQ